MFDIVANAVGFDRRPELDELVTAMSGLSRREPLAKNDNAPMLVINGISLTWAAINRGRPV